METVLPWINEAFIISSAIVFGFGWWQIRRGHRETHRRLMITGSILAALFFISYVFKTVVVGDTTFGAEKVPARLSNLFADPFHSGDGCSNSGCDHANLCSKGHLFAPPQDWSVDAVDLVHYRSYRLGRIPDALHHLSTRHNHEHVPGLDWLIRTGSRTDMSSIKAIRANE